MSTKSNNPEQGQGLLAVFEKNPKRFGRIKFLSQLFETAGYELRIAGGAVRDILRGKEPEDIDFATTARPERTLEIVKKHENILRIIVTTAGQKHGTVAVKFKEIEIDSKKIKLEPKGEEEKNLEEFKSAENFATTTPKPIYDDESPFEITTLRCDNITDGRHAEVEFINDWRIDAERRDLTINAMFLTLDEGKLIDYFGGEPDLKNGIVRFVGDADKRIKEDYLRILRYFRFWSRYGRNNQPDSETNAIMKKNLEGLDIISGERIWQEVKKTLSYLPCSDVLELMLKLEVPKFIGLVDKDLKEDSYDEYVEQVMKEIKLVELNVKNYLEQCNSVNNKLKELIPVILFATTVKSYDMCMNAHKRMKFSNVEKDSILYILENRDKNPPLRALKYQVAMITPSERYQMLYRIQAYLIFKGKSDLIDQIVTWKVPPFPISGSTVAQRVRQNKLPPTTTKNILEHLRDIWAISDYELNKEELEEKLDVRIAEIVGRNANIS